MSFLESKFGLSGKTAVITGGGGTLCGAIAQGYAQAGANVVLWDVRADALAAKVQALVDACGDSARVAAIQVDLLDEAAIGSALQSSVGRFGRIDILFNGARPQRFDPYAHGPLRSTRRPVGGSHLPGRRWRRVRFGGLPAC